MEKVGYLGPKGSYSSLACEMICPTAEYREYPTFKEVMSSLIRGECNSIVLPIENSLNGGVSQNIDLLQKTDGVIATKECVLKVDHRLAYLKGTKLEEVERVYSHEQALAQCGEYLYKNLPNAKLLSVPSTAAGLDMIKTKGDAGIVGAQTKREGIELSNFSIADEKYNFTHFLYIVKGEIDEGEATRKIYFSVTCNHEHGALLKLLQPLAENGLNMTKIESRPIKGSTGEYRFFIEIEGDYSDKDVRAVLNTVKSRANTMKILGAYS